MQTQLIIGVADGGMAGRVGFRYQVLRRGRISKPMTEGKSASSANHQLLYPDT